MVLAREICPSLSNLMDFGMRMDWWYGDGLGRRRPSSGKRGGAAGDAKEEGRAAEASAGGPTVPLLLCPSPWAWAESLASISASFCCLRMYSRVSYWLNWAWSWVEKET